MAMQAWITDRLTLLRLLQQHPTWSLRQLATATGRSVAWVKKWKARWRTVPWDDRAAIQRRAHPAPPQAPWSDRVIARILALRDELPTTLHRIAGPKAILYYLHRDPALADESRPQSAKTIWKILRQHQRILTPPPHQHHPLERPAPLEELELDWTDLTTIPPEPGEKRQHQAEVLNIVDRGTSMPLLSLIRGDFTMATTIQTLAAFFATHGCPPRLRFDRDPRLMGAPTMRDFPSQLLRLLLCLGIDPIPCPPHRPDLKPYVERFNKTVIHECLAPAHPTTIAEAQTVVDAYLPFYCTERPHQGDVCHNQPPAQVFPHLPDLPGVPDMVDPDAWVRAIDGMSYMRRVAANGQIQLAKQSYSVGTAWTGTDVTVQIAAATQEVVIWSNTTIVKRWRIKGLVGALLPYTEWVTLLATEADRLEARMHERYVRRTTPRRRG